MTSKKEHQLKKLWSLTDSFVVRNSALNRFMVCLSNGQQVEIQQKRRKTVPPEREETKRFTASVSLKDCADLFGSLVNRLKK